MKKVNYFVLFISFLTLLISCGEKPRISNYYIETVAYSPQMEMCIKKDLCNNYLSFDKKSGLCSISDEPVEINKELGAISLLNARILTDSISDGLHKVTITQKDSLGKFQVEVFVSENGGQWRCLRSMDDITLQLSENLCEKIQNTALISIINN